LKTKFLSLFLLFVFLSIATFTWKTAIKPFEKNGKMGYLNLFGQVIIEPVYSFAGDFGDGGFWKDLAVVSTAEKNKRSGYGCIDRWGHERIKCRFNRIGKQAEGFVLVVDVDINGTLICGFDDFYDRMPIPLQFSAGDAFSEGMAPVAMRTEPFLWGFIKKDFSRTGKVAIPYQFENASSFVNGRATVRIKDNLIGIIDQSGKILRTQKEEDIKDGDE